MFSHFGFLHMLLDYKLCKDKLCAGVSVTEYCKLLLIERLLELGHLGKSLITKFFENKRFFSFFFYKRTSYIYFIDC